jgi:hypothetical protein
MESKKLIAVVPITYFENGVRKGINPGAVVGGVVPDSELEDLRKIGVVKYEESGDSKRDTQFKEGSEEFQAARKEFIARQESLSAGVESQAEAIPGAPAAPAAPKGRGKAAAK